MHPLMTMFVLNLPSTVCTLAAAYLAINESGIWGWFLLTAVIMAETTAPDVFRVDLRGKEKTRNDS